MPVTSAVTAPYKGTSNQTQIAKTHSISDADSPMLSNTRTNTVRHTKYTTPPLDKLSELRCTSIFIRLLFPYSLFLASELSRRKSVTATREQLSRSLHI